MAMMRYWSAVKIDGKVCCRIEDLPFDVHLGAATSERRLYRLSNAPEGEDAHLHGDSPCEPAQPCARCHQEARQWWPEWEHRQKALHRRESSTPVDASPIRWGITEKEAVAFFSDLFGGDHHIPKTKGAKSGVRGWDSDGGEAHWHVILPREADCATWDGDLLTRLVFLAHDRCYRAAVSSSGFSLKISITRRVPEEQAQGMAKIHPSLEIAVRAWRGWHADTTRSDKA